MYSWKLPGRAANKGIETTTGEALLMQKTPSFIRLSTSAPDILARRGTGSRVGVKGVRVGRNFLRDSLKLLKVGLILATLCPDVVCV